MTDTFNKLPDLPQIKDIELDDSEQGFHDVMKSPTAFLNDDGSLSISGEDVQCFVDYSGEYRGVYPYIAPEIEAWATARGGHWEWNDPGSITFYL